MTTPLYLIVASLSAEPSTGEVVQFVLNGLVVVIVALSILAISCALVGWVLKQFEVPAVESQPEATSPEEVTGETVAVIAAAVAAVFDRPHRIVHVRGLTPEDAAWALQGRMQHHSSHILPHRDHR